MVTCEEKLAVEPRDVKDSLWSHDANHYMLCIATCHIAAMEAVHSRQARKALYRRECTLVYMDLLGEKAFIASV